MASETTMDYKVVTDMANGFGVAGDTLDAIDKVLTAAIAALHAAAFFSLGGTELMAQYLEGIEPHIKKLSAMSKELKSDLTGAVNYIQNGDTTGSQKFV